MVNSIVEQLKSIGAFRVDAEDYDWLCSYPDIIFEIILDAVPTKEQVSVAVTALEEFVHKYNKWHSFRPIDYISGIDRLPEGPHPRGIYIHIDFGSASATAVVSAVEVLAKTNLPIFRVALQW
ncbi:MAG: hypothetical protein IJN53_04405 [Oscillospiraceae bacterium]|nr:hypothetical protein [Oscillospiraceae bacterium]